jgi:hypothetical protein
MSDRFDIARLKDSTTNIEVDEYLAEYRKNHIPMDQCKDGFLYIIDARNSKLGIYKEANKSFTISRYKFGSNFLFEEFHWGTGSPYGTVQPLKEIMAVPVMSDEEKLAYLNTKWVELKEEVSSHFPEITRFFNWTETGWVWKGN